MSEYYIGLMSGTSVDAIDTVLMDFSKSNTHIASSYKQTIDASLRNEIQTLIADNQIPKNYEKVDQAFALASCNAVKALLKQSAISASEIIAIGSHGQTVFHDPKGSPSISIQIGNPQQIANHTGIPTIGNFRKADIDAGGEGAPLACAYHAEILQSTSEDRVVLNLGGIANITKLPKDLSESIIGFDTGPANTLMDAWALKNINKPFDNNGNWAKSGKVNVNLLKEMLSDPYFEEAPPKSTGREHFNLDWLSTFTKKITKTTEPQDIQASLLALSVKSISNSIKNWCPETKNILLCGGGGSNKFFIEQLSKTLPSIQVQHTDEYGVPAKWMEAMAFAWLAKLHIENKPGNIPSVTGAREYAKLGELA